MFQFIFHHVNIALILFSAGQDVVFLHFNDADEHPLDCGKLNETVLEELHDIGGLFKFRFFNLKQSNAQMNNNNFKELLHCLKSKCME